MEIIGNFLAVKVQTGIENPRRHPDPEPNPKVSSTRTLDVPNLGLYFPTRATLQELEFGAVVTIDATLFDGGSVDDSPLGKAQGVYVASSEGDAGHMMAMTTVFADGGFKNGLRFFGLHRRDASESHIALIGGTGKYTGANGYATVKVVKQGVNKLLLFNVYLS
ncbi:dirigent protein 25-like [Hibiscus syriacus]|uniref:dirigent protein 25-like n=1 Tax=Hibiscus syriacus TaxID=106335 RepID=UPI001920AD5B|nr:dirigent protein 25-like [Hibiscus syriacus]